MVNSGSIPLYTTKINNMKDIANKNNLKIITTEKDFLRLTKKQQKGINFLKVKLKIKDMNNEVSKNLDYDLIIVDTK